MTGTTQFRKMNGLGNDFVVLDARAHALALGADAVRAIADRKEGIGCDQIIALEPSRKADVFMRIWNADGGEVGACGNAARCVAALLAAERGEPKVSIETESGVLGAVVNEALRAFPDDVQVIAEPGRYLVSDAGYFVCRVLGTAMRAGKRWMHWDAGLFGGVIETTEGLKYKIRTDRSGPDIAWNVAGPTCDSVDVVMRDEPLPSDLQEGDFIYIRNAGAYTTAYASGFNGFPLPEVRVFESRTR